MAYDHGQDVEHYLSRAEGYAGSLVLARVLVMLARAVIAAIYDTRGGR